jgi:hypothetical protein
MRRARGEWELADAYAAARYWLPAAGGAAALTFDTHAGEEEVSAKLAEMLPRGTWAIIGAANPWSVELSAAENARRTEGLAREISRAGLAAQPMHNAAADGDWREPSLLVEGATREQALRWCSAFAQAAAVFGIGTRCGLLWTRSERWVVLRARMTER